MGVSSVNCALPPPMHMSLTRPYLWVRLRDMAPSPRPRSGPPRDLYSLPPMQACGRRLCKGPPLVPTARCKRVQRHLGAPPVQGAAACARGRRPIRRGASAPRRGACAGGRRGKISGMLASIVAWGRGRQRRHCAPPYSTRYPSKSRSQLDDICLYSSGQVFALLGCR